jgi:hypothetical protein
MLLCTILLSQHNLFAQVNDAALPPLPLGINVAINLSESETVIGQDIPMTLTISIPSDSPFHFDQYDLAALDGITSYSIEAKNQDWQANAAKTGSGLSLMFTVSAWRTGEIEITAPPVALLHNDGSRAMCDPAIGSTLKVLETLVTSNNQLPEKKPLRGAVTLELTPWERLQLAAPWIAGGIVALLLVYWLLRKLLAPKPFVPLTPRQWVDQAMAKLREELPDSKEAMEEWHYALGLAARGYIARRWNFHAEEKTSYETVEMLKVHAPDVSPQLVTELEYLLEETDGVKYAREAASKLTCQDRLQRLEDFVEKTPLVEQVESPSEPEANTQREAA